MGGGQSGEVTPQIPEELKPLISGSVAGTLGTMRGLPLPSFGQMAPRGIAGLSDLQMFGMERIPELWGQSPALGAAYGAYTLLPEIASQAVSTPGAEQYGAQLAQGLSSGPIGSSPATTAGMEAWRQSVLPTVEQEMTQAGLGRSGDLLKAVGSSASQAAFPLIQQEIANRAALVPQMLQYGQQATQRELQPRQDTMRALELQGRGMIDIGQATFQQQQAAIDMALKAGQISQQTAQSRLDAAYDDFLRLQQLSSQATMGPTQLLPSTIGSKTQTNRQIGVMDILGK